MASSCVQSASRALIASSTCQVAFSFSPQRPHSFSSFPVQNLIRQISGLIFVSCTTFLDGTSASHWTFPGIVVEDCYPVSRWWSSSSNNLLGLPGLNLNAIILNLPAGCSLSAYPCSHLGSALFATVEFHGPLQSTRACVL